MKITNEEVMIKNSNKKICLKNKILNNYLETFAHSNLANIDIDLKTLLLKFDEELPEESFDLDSKITNDSFDIAIFNKKIITNTSEKRIDVSYYYDTENKVYNYLSRQPDATLANYINRKITAIGFTTSFFPRKKSYGYNQYFYLKFKS